MKNNNLLLLSAVVIAALAGFVPAGGAVAAAGPGILHSQAGLPEHVPSAVAHGAVQVKSDFGERTDARTLRVLSLVESRTSDPRVLSQIRHKLSTVSDGQLQMLSSLSERVVSRGGKAESDVAFLLLTALIIFS